MIRYVTRWALSTGIRKLEGEYSEHGYFHAEGLFISVSKRETFETLEAAQVEARTMAKKKIASLKKQIAILESSSWTAKVVD